MLRAILVEKIMQTFFVACKQDFHVCQELSVLQEVYIQNHDSSKNIQFIRSSAFGIMCIDKQYARHRELSLIVQIHTKHIIALL